jgi:hypothetical protein
MLATSGESNPACLLGGRRTDLTSIHDMLLA